MHNIAKLLTEHVNGGTFIAINTSTIPRMTGGKKNPFMGRVRKVMEGATVMVFQNKKSNAYANMVDRRLVKEGKDPSSFTLGPRRWGTRLPNVPFIEHRKNDGVHYYLEVIFLRKGTITYTVDGQPVDPSTITGLVMDVEESAQGGLDDKVIIRSFKMESITQITVAKETYRDLYFNLDEV